MASAYELRKWKNIREGYLEALGDTLRELNQGGEEAAREWIENNS